MSKAYILVYDDKVGSRESVTDFLDKRPEIKTWRFDLPNTFYLISDQSAHDLAMVLQENLTMRQEGKRFIIALLGDDIQGWLPRETWNFINQRGGLE